MTGVTGGMSFGGVSAMGGFPPQAGGQGGDDAEAGAGGHAEGGAGGQVDTPVAQVSVNANHVCAVSSEGSVKCWGLGAFGALGYGSFVAIGDDELPLSVSDVAVAPSSAGQVTQVVVGLSHSCARLSKGGVACWGGNQFGELGHGNTAGTVGGIDPPDSASLVLVTDQGNLGTQKLVAGDSHTCALLADKSVTCWGRNDLGQLGYGNTDDIGDSEAPALAGEVQVTAEAGLNVVDLAAGADHTCALVSDGSVRCWGANEAGQLGRRHDRNIGDDELPSTGPSVSLSSDPSVMALQLTAGYQHTCALLSDDSVRCWGTGAALGLGEGAVVGDDELPSQVDAIDFGVEAGVKVTQIAAGSWHTCARFSNGSLKCWGGDGAGQLGYGNLQVISLPAAVGFVSVTSSGAKVKAIAAGGYDSCALLSDGSLKCWGFNETGQLGQGNTTHVGDNELPSSIEAIQLW